jgi:UDP-glucose 4-epimerase
VSMNILITGGAGFIGSHIAKSLLADGYEINIVDNLSTGNLENVPDGAKFTKTDLRFPEALQEIPSNDYKAVLHLAGQSSGEKSFDDPLYDLDANCRSTSLLASWALKNRIPVFIYASSMGVYGEPQFYPVPETAFPRPVSYYGASKYCAEQVLRVASLQGMRTVCFRMFNVYGPGQNLADLRQGMVSIFLAQLLRERSLFVKGSVHRVRDFIYIDDVVSAWKMAIQRPVNGIFNLGTGKATELTELISVLLEACNLDKNCPVSEGEGTPGDQFAISADITAIREVLGWEPKVSLAQGVDRTVAWARNMVGSSAPLQTPKQ